LLLRGGPKPVWVLGGGEKVLKKKGRIGKFLFRVGYQYPHGGKNVESDTRGGGASLELRKNAMNGRSKFRGNIHDLLTIEIDLLLRRGSKSQEK